MSPTSNSSSVTIHPNLSVIVTDLSLEKEAFQTYLQVYMDELKDSNYSIDLSFIVLEVHFKAGKIISGGEKVYIYIYI